MTSRKLIVSGLLAALPLVLAGCSSAGSTPDAGGAAVTTPAAAPTSHLTGTQLASTLLTASEIGSGFASNQSSAVNSGGSLTTAAAKYKPESLSCTDLMEDVGRPGYGESAMAYDELSNGSSGDELDESVYQFASASEANVVFTSLQAKWNSCASFTVTTSVTGKVTIAPISAPSGLGDMAFADTLKVTLPSTTMNGSMVYVLKGADVYCVSPANILGETPSLSAKSLMTQLMTKVASAG
ncbi:sensor domain-containing protein [Actinospica robiniae]|uniref:sensor domain-containing protein n=1 Tax=Actinospica robiniae TaxID=304901 RepID=UPI000558FF2F|nr:sensor domain-containing protein [Actinospica robiniae]